MAKAYRKRPSELLELPDAYTAYCFDEACLYIEARRAEGVAPVYRTEVSSMHDFYARIER